MKEIIKSGLIDFICAHCGGVDREGVVGTLDEIILNYVVGVLEDVLDLKKRNKTEDFDVVEFSEMLSGYFPLFGNIPSHVVIEWVEQLVGGLMGAPKQPRTLEMETAWIDDPSTTSKPLHESDDITAKLTSINLTEDESEEEESQTRVRTLSNQSDDSHMETLGEMFPNYSQSDLGMVLNLVNHDLQRAVQILLLDNGEQEIVKGLLVKPGGAGGKKSSCPIAAGGAGGDKVDDKKGLKERLMARYGFIDKSEDGREFRPILPKAEPKKLVRYRGGQIVSTKGERFTEVAVTHTGEEVKLRSYPTRAQRQAIAEGHGRFFNN